MSVEQRTRWAWIVCPQCDGDFDFRMQNEDGVPLQCPWCTEGKIKAKLIRVAKGSAARGGGYKTSRTTPDIKFSKAVRERDGYRCTVCLKDFSDNPAGLDAMHYVKRGYKALRKGYAKHTGNGCCLRHEMDNALAGCKSCHARLEGKPEHETHFRAWWGDAHCDSLQAQKPKSQKIVERRSA